MIRHWQQSVLFNTSIQVTFGFICIIIIIRFKIPRMIYSSQQYENSFLSLLAGGHGKQFHRFIKGQKSALLQDRMKTISRCSLLLDLPKISILSINIKTTTLNCIKGLIWTGSVLNIPLDGTITLHTWKIRLNDFPSFVVCLFVFFI